MPEVSSALAEISQLKMINAEVIEAVHPPGGLTDAHMYELLSLSADAAAKSTCTKDQGVILARWLLAAEHDVHLAVPCAGHATPVAASPFWHVHCFVAHWRLCVLLGATVSYSALVHVVHATHASLLR